MTRSEINIIKRALQILHRLVPGDEPRAIDAPSRCSVTLFAKRYLTRQPGGDMSTAELFQFYAEVAASGELEALSRTEVLRRLPNVLEMVFDVRKSHNLQRAGGRVRGFKGITLREHANPVTTLAPELEGA